MRFGLTGITQSMSVLDVGSYLQLYQVGVELRAKLSEREDVLVERFPTETLANNALNVAAEALPSQYLTKLESKSPWKGWKPWVLAPLVVLGILEGLYFYMMAHDAQKDALLSTPTLSMAPLQYDSQSIPSTAAESTQTQLAAASPVMEPARLSQLLRDVVNKGKYSLTYATHEGQDVKQTLYVFSDPNCIYCRTLDAQMKNLGQKYTVHLFPVSIVGGEASRRLGEQVLCLKPEARAKWWELTLSGVAVTRVEVTDICRQAIDDNNQVFRALQFRGTPTILNGMGQEVPEWMPHTAEALDMWMQSELTK